MTAVPSSCGPVSYTHLADCFKFFIGNRNLQSQISEYLFVVIIEIQFWFCKTDGIDSVSYTHLDVYKRQLGAIDYLVKLELSEESLVQALESAIEPVSYTHLCQGT